MKKLNIGKFIYFLFIIFTFSISFCRATSNTEGLIEKDAKKYRLKSGVTLDQKTFNKIFPASNPKDFSHGWYCGQLRSLKGGRGTGTLLTLEKKDDHYIGTGITALHVFLEPFSGHKGIKQYRYTPSNWTFYQNSTSIDDDNLSYFAEIEVLEVLFVPDSGKDTCLFKGKYILNGDYLPEELSEIIPVVQANLPKVRKSIITSGKTIDASFYHYPLGELYQRKNKGKASSENSTHTISSLPGSSGASLIYKKLIIGIHIGSVDSSDTGLVYKYATSHEMTVVKKNSFNAVSENDIESMQQSTVDLHKLTIEVLYSTLVPAIYPEAHFQSEGEHNE